MRAVVLDEYGGTDVLQIREVPDPIPGAEEVLVDVAATALNRADLLQRMGLYPGPPMTHEIPGMEFAGTVAAVGERVTSTRVGAQVMGIVGGGAYAERLVTHERLLLAVPENISPSDAAAIPETFITAFDALVVQGGLTGGRCALVHAGGSGVGTSAIQIAKAIGASVIVTASESKVARCVTLGADLAVDYMTTDFVESVLEFTDGNGVDVILDVIGGQYVNRNIDCLAVGGRIIQVGVMGGAAPTVAIGELLRRRGHLIGTTLRARPIEEKIAITRRFGIEMSGRFARGELHPVIDSRYPFDEVAEAHRHMASNTNFGKIVLDVMR